ILLDFVCSFRDLFRVLQSFPTRRSSDLQASSNFLTILRLLIIIPFGQAIGKLESSGQWRRVKGTSSLDTFGRTFYQKLFIYFKRSEEHTSELSHVSISYAVFCLKKKKTK